MPRHRFTVMSALSLLMCLSTLIVWVRSYSVWDSFDWDAPGNMADRRTIGIAEGKVYFYRILVQSPGVFVKFSRPPGFFQQPATIQIGALPLRWSYLGFAWLDTTVSGIRSSELRVPLWPIAALGLVLPLMKLIRPRPRSGLCPSCGYDLRATPDRCPECGTAMVVVQKKGLIRMHPQRAIPQHVISIAVR